MNGYKLSEAARAYWASSKAGRPAPSVKAADTVRAINLNGTAGTFVPQNYGWQGECGNALGLAATFACVNLLAGTTASLSATVRRPDRDGVLVEARDHPLFWVLRMDPNFDQSDYEFWEFMSASIELHGNGFARIARNAIGQVISLTPVQLPQNVTVKRRGDGGLHYKWTEDGREIEVGQAEVFHVRGFGGDGLKGASTLSVCGGTFRAASATDSTASQMFANGARPSGLLSMAETLSGEQRAELEEALATKFMGAMNAGRPMVLDRGLKWDSLSINPEDAQLLDSRKFSGEEICRIFGVPPAMVGFGDKSSNWGTGKEVDVLGFIKFTLRKRLRRIERAAMKQLLTREERQAGMTIEFNLEGLLRGDSAGRAAFYQVMVRLGLMTRNEARRLENLPPIPGGDVAMVQMQDVPLSDAIANGANP